MGKAFLDLEGLQKYDELIKAYIDAAAETSNSDLDAEIARAKAAETALSNAISSFTSTVNSKFEADEADIASNTSAISANKEAIAAVKSAVEVLNGTGDGSVSKQVSDAVAALVASAPETLDTLKEIADWIANDETGTANLTAQVQANTNAIKDNLATLENKDAELKAYVDAQDLNYYNQIGSIADMSIKALFMDKKTVAEGQTVQAAISALGENEMLVLNEGSVVAEDLTIPEGTVIDANGSTFSGNLTVAEDAIINNAVFTGKVTIA